MDARPLGPCLGTKEDPGFTEALGLIVGRLSPTLYLPDDVSFVMPGDAACSRHVLKGFGKVMKTVPPQGETTCNP